MKKRPVHITGMGCFTSLGKNVAETWKALLASETRIAFVEEWSKVSGLESHVAAFVGDYDTRKIIPRKKRRTMSRMSEILCIAGDEALSQAGLSKEELNHRRCMIICGSTTGSPEEISHIHKLLHTTNSAHGQESTSVFKCMSHTVAMNLGLYLDFIGQIVSPASACCTGSQSVVLGKMMIEAGIVDIVLAGGADECNVMSAISFDAAYAASRRYNHAPEKASRPFDADRDGIVVSEGASLLVLESWDSLAARESESLAEISGGSFLADSTHMSQLHDTTIARTMKMALDDAGLRPADISYINAHATGTRQGDLNEAIGIRNLFGSPVKVSSLKGHLGHSFAACGSTELIMSVKMQRERTLIPTLNLDNIDPELPPLDYLTETKSFDGGPILSNNFAFGGMNTSVIIR